MSTPSNPEVKQLIDALKAQLERTLEILDGITEDDLASPNAHGCAVGKTLEGLLIHNIEHDRMHLGQIATKRWELGVMQQDSAHRLMANLITERANLIASLVGLPDSALDQRPEPTTTTIREVVEHVLYWERDSMEHTAKERHT